jgi:predicted nucleic acid-binding protein
VPELCVFDTSAIFAFTDQEDGAAEVERLVQAARAQKCQIEVCSITLMEVYYITLRGKGEDEAARLTALIKAWPMPWVYPDEQILLQAGKLKALHRLFVADALIVAVAKLHGATLVHKDPEIAVLTDDLSLLTLPLK